MKKYQEYVNFSLINPDLITPIVIGNKKLVQVSDVTIKSLDIRDNDPIGRKVLGDIPHYILKFMDLTDNTILEVDIILHKPVNRDGWNNYDFNVNSYTLNNDGIHSTNDSPDGFLGFLNSIKNREAECIIDFEKLNSKASRIGVFRSEKVPYHMQMAFMLNKRFKILNFGYKTIKSKTKLIDYSINTEEDCMITGCKPPYYDVTLKCGHTISLMAYIGIIEDSVFATSEAIKCPICRDNLALHLLEKLSTPIDTIQLCNISEIINSKIANCKLEEKEESKLLSEDSEIYICDLINKKSHTIIDQNAGQVFNLNAENQNIRAIGRGRNDWDTS